MSSNLQGAEIPVQRLQDLKKMSGSFADSENVFQFLLKAEKPQKSNSGIEPVIFTRGDDRSGIINSNQTHFLQSQIEDACKNPSSFLVLTPEFSLYSKHDKADPIVFDDQGNITQGQNTVIEAFNQTKALAKKYNKSIVLSSLCEKKILIGSLKPILIHDVNNNQHELAVIVCQERGLKSTYLNLSNSIDIVAVPVSEGSFSTSRDVSAVTSYGESTAIRENLGEKFKGKNVTIAITNERTNRASVIGFDGEKNITTISLK